MARTGAALSVELEMQRTATLRATARRDAIVIAIRGVECFRRRQGQNCKLATAGVAGAMLRRFRTCMSPSLSHSTPRDPRSAEIWLQFELYIDRMHVQVII